MTQPKYELVPFNFTIQTPNKEIGQALIISLPYNVTKGDLLSFRVYYKTNENATAFSWLTKDQTLGKKLPYLFTQCQAIACRSLAPMQDSPAVKATYDASVVAPKEFTVKMSANDTTSFAFNSTHVRHNFENRIAIPSYLIALAVGDLQKVPLGKRVNLISEP